MWNVYCLSFFSNVAAAAAAARGGRKNSTSHKKRKKSMKQDHPQLQPQSATTTKYPVVLIHGAFGYGKTHPFFNFGTPYWPESHLNRLNPNHLIVEVGALASDHDRACEVFFALKGGRVDYGEAHAKQTKHDRYGRLFETALHPNWSAENPVHLLGHSCGSTTALDLYQLICNDAFGFGTDHRWVKSMVCISGPLTGSTLAHLVGFIGEDMPHGTVAHYASACFCIWYRLTLLYPWLNKVYDFRMPQWYRHATSFADMIAHDNPFHVSRDGALHTLVPSYRVRRNRSMKDMNKLFLLSVVNSPDFRDFVPTVFELVVMAFALWMIGSHLAAGQLLLRAVCIAALGVAFFKRLHRLDIANMPTFHALMWLIRRHAKHLVHDDASHFEGYDADTWKYNDGLVNIKSMLRPWFPTTSKCAASCHVVNGSSTDAASAASSLASKAASRKPVTPRSAHGDSDDSIMTLEVEDTGKRLQYKLPPKVLTDEDQQKQLHRLDKGHWYVHRVHKNHLCGTWWDRDAEQLYRRIFSVIRSEFE